MRIQDFKHYCKENFGIDEVFRQIPDKRKRPQIKTKQIIWAIVNMVSLGIKSLLELDQLGRLRQMRTYIGTKRYLVSSDTTYERVLHLMPINGIRKAMKKIYLQLRQQNLDRIKLESGKEFRIAAVDASGFGRQLASVLSVFGKIQIPLDVELYSQKGKGASLKL